MSIQDVVIYINKELARGRTMKEIEEVDFHVNKGVIQKRIQRKGYKKVENKFIFITKDNNTKQTTIELQKDIKVATNILQEKPSNEEDKKTFKNDEIERLNKLLKLDINILEKMIQEYTTKENTKSSIYIKDNSTIVTSIRVNKELYLKLKQRAKKDNIKLQDIFYDMMVNYLSK